MFFALRAMLRDPEAKVLALTALGVIAIGSVVYMVLEHWGPIDAVYFCVVTLATVGYGDLHPTTDAGKIFTVIYILSGLGILAAFVTELARHRAVGHGRLSSALSDAELAARPLGRRRRVRSRRGRRRATPGRRRQAGRSGSGEPADRHRTGRLTDPG